jgi:hypothetical protein
MAKHVKGKATPKPKTESLPQNKAVLEMLLREVGRAMDLVDRFLRRAQLAQRRYRALIKGGHDHQRLAAFFKRMHTAEERDWAADGSSLELVKGY